MSEVHYEWALGGAYPFIQQHSVAKHEILRAYLVAYIQTLISTPNQEVFRLAIIDGFAGGGVYRGKMERAKAGVTVLKSIGARSLPRPAGSDRRPKKFDGRRQRMPGKRDDTRVVQNSAPVSHCG